MSKTKQVIENYLKKNGITNSLEMDEIISGFDLNRPVYEQQIWGGAKLYQYVRNPSSSFNGIGVGRWFCIKGATMDSLGIFSGGSGRNLTMFKVKHPIVGLEGTARKMGLNWTWAGGGRGGATQIFITKNMFYALENLGTQLN